MSEMNSVSHIAVPYPTSFAPVAGTTPPFHEIITSHAAKKKITKRVTVTISSFIFFLDEFVDWYTVSELN